MEKYKYKISVVIPVYNVEKYLEDTIESVINQSIGFENIQMILVNDGSPDNSEEICLRYKDKYPDNILYIKKENGGVSSARNEGIKHIEGKYVNFLDSDDKQGLHAYEKAYNILENDNSVDVCVFRMRYFEKTTEYHYLDWKFKGPDRVVDLSKEPNNPFFHITCAILRSEVARKVKFDTNIKLGEDFKYLAECVMQKSKVGLISSETFYYRRRMDESSAVQTSRNKRDFYMITPKLVFEYLLKLSKKHPKSKKWLQYTIAMDLRFRLVEINFGAITLEEGNEYRNLIRDIYNQIDDEIITTQTDENISNRYRALEYKYNKPIIKDVVIKDGEMFLYGKKIMDVSELSFKIFVFNIRGNKLNITGTFDSFMNGDLDVFVKSNDKYYPFTKYKLPEPSSSIFGNEYEHYINNYDIDFDLDGVSEFEICIKIQGKYYTLTPLYRNFSKINEIPDCYYKKRKTVITYRNNKYYVNEKKHFRFLKYLKSVYKNKNNKKIAVLLLIYKLTYPFVRHDNWLVTDRFDVAGDNGEYFFEYLKKNSKKRNIYFVLKKSSKDRSRLEKIGKVLDFKSISFFIKYMNSEAIISSQIDNYIRRPYGLSELYLNPFTHFKYVFLQHGVTKNDMSGWLCKTKKNIDFLVCSGDIEYNEFLRESYMYDDRVIRLTGMPRFDNLYGLNLKNENYLAFMPTWRTSLVAEVNTKTQKRGYNKNFVNTEYYQFYNNLVNDKRITDCLKKHKLKILFCLHPMLNSQAKDFKDTKYVTFKTGVNYQQVFKTANMLLTDYSSVAFDFAYTNKPLIYAHFDKDHLYEIHTTVSGDAEYDYEKDGFGKVLYDYESTVKEIIKIVEGGFKPEKKYIDRMHKFFKYNDDKNCERVEKGIIKMIEED